MEDRVIVMEEKGGFPRIYTSLNSDVSEETAIERANLIYARELALYKKNHLEYEHIDPVTGREYWAERIEKLSQTKMSVMTVSMFEEKEREAYLSVPMREITKEEFDYFLNVLPPYKWTTRNGVEQFCMSEMISGPFTTQYARAGDRYYTKYVDVTDDSTWLDQYLKTERSKKLPKGYDKNARPIHKSR